MLNDAQTAEADGRWKQITRAGHMPDKDVFSLGSFRLFRGARLLTRNGVPVRLPGGAAELLLALIDAPDAVLGLPALQAALREHQGRHELEALAAAINQVLAEGGANHRVARLADDEHVLLGEVARSRVGALDDEATPGRLPLPPAVLIGRDDPIRAGLAQVALHRMLTITGVGGVGKTTLAVAIAQGASPAFADGVRFVDLAPLTRSASLASAVFTSLDWESRTGLPERGESADEMLTHALADREILIVLDNCEHVIDGAAQIAEQLLRAPGVKVLATSREPLRCHGENLLPLGPMDVPPEDAEPTLDQADRYGAVRMFLSRLVKRQQTDTALSADDFAAVFQVCRRLDGIPLALELAAAHVEPMGLRQLLERLEDSTITPLVNDGQASERHQTLVATLDWSHALLSAQEQLALRRLSVFRGDFAVDSALRVLAVGGDDDASSLEALVGLQSKSMLTARVMNGMVHYRLLETTRVYAQARLAEDPCGAEIRRRHALECQTRLDGAEADWVHMNAAHWRGIYGRLISDVRAAIDWSFSQQGDPQLGADLLICSTALAARLALFDEHVGQLRRAIRHLVGLGMLYPKQELRLYVALRSLTANAMDTDGDFGSHDRLLALADALQDGDSNALAAWVSLWLDAMNRADYPQALSAARWQMAWAARHGDDIDVADARRALAYPVHFMGDQQQAQTLALQVLERLPNANRAQYFNAGQLDLRVSMRIILARAQWLQGRYRRGMETAMEAVHLAEQEGPRAVCLALSFAACPIALWNGEKDVASDLLVRLRVAALRIQPSPHGRWADWFEFLLSRDDLRGGEEAPAGFDEPSDMQVDLLITAGCSWLLPRARKRVERQVVGWCAPEVSRVLGEQAWRAGQPDEARRYIESAISLARREGQMAWALRASTSLARLHMAAGEPQQALSLLRPYCGPNAEAAFNQDEREARAVFAQAMAQAWR